jgi:hypothetical protein
MIGFWFTEKMIYPKQFPATINDISSEHHYYRRFMREINPDENVYYSLTLITPDVPMREIDFVVLNRYGIVTIELKNGRWKVNRGKWEFYNVREREWKEVEGKAYNGPVEQASTQASLLKEFLKNHNGLEDFFPDEYHDSAIFFLKNNRAEFYLKNSKSPWIFGKDQLEDESISLQTIINQIQNRESRKPLDASIIQKIHQVLVKNLNFISNFNPRANSTEDKLLALTKEQFSLISEITTVPRSIVYGVAGSGKSILAGQLGLKLSENNQTVAIWQGSKALFELWKKELEDMNLFPKPILVHEPSLLTETNFDFLIIDQIEDWIDKHSLNDLKMIISENYWKNGKWSIFVKRSLKYSESPILEFLASTVHRSFDITRNIRNSPEIAEFANLMSDGEGGQAVLDTLTDVQLISVDKKDDLVEKLKWCFGYAKKILGIIHEDIRVICPEPKFKFEEPELVQFLKEHSISFLTVDEFSGMEDSCGILIGFKDWEQTETRTLVSQAVLLFRDLVCILYDEKEESIIRNILKKSGPGP